MPYNIDPFLANLRPLEIPLSTPPPTEDWLNEREARLRRLGMDKGVLGDINARALKTAGTRSALKSTARDYATDAAKWATSM